MTSPEERIKELARKNAIDPATAERLLAAVRVEAVTRGGWNPFARRSAEQWALVGLAGVAIGVLVSRLGLANDGALDLHTGDPIRPVWRAVVDQALSFPLAALLLWAVARPFAAAVRVIDMLGTVGLAHLVLMVSSLPLALAEHGASKSEPLGPLGFVALAIGVLGWSAQIYLMLLGFRTATGLRGGRLAAVFVGALFVAEVVTQIASHLIGG